MIMIENNTSVWYNVGYTGYVKGVVVDYDKDAGNPTFGFGRYFVKVTESDIPSTKVGTILVAHTAELTPIEFV